MSKATITGSDHIKRGDVIGPNGSVSKLGLVYAVMRAGESIEGFKILPIHIHDLDYRHPNDKNNFMLPNSIKSELGLRMSSQYRVEFVLEDIPAPEEKLFLRHAKAGQTIFGCRTLDRMERKILDERKASNDTTHEERVFVFHKDEPTHVKEKRRPGKPERADISIDDAFAAGLISETLLNVLSSGYYGRDKKITTLREVYELATSDKPKDANRYASILKSGLMNCTASLRAAFKDGVIYESSSFNQLRDMDINQLGSAMREFGQISSKGYKSTSIDEYDVDHFLIQPYLSVNDGIIAGWKNFIDKTGNRPEELAGFKYMYPA